jgi:flagellar hook protein FlgE
LTHNQNKLDVISHNVANANAFAFKKFRPLHEGIPSPELDLTPAGSASPDDERPRLLPGDDS